jgi:serine/threonine protein kinase
VCEHLQCHNQSPTSNNNVLVSCRDLKLDNTILDHRDPPRLKLCDFGFAKAWAANSNMDTMRIGTPEYMGPELISGRCATGAVLGPSGILFFWGGLCYKWILSPLNGTLEY